MPDRPADAIKTLHRVATELQNEDSVAAVCERTAEAAAEILQFRLCVIFIREGEQLAPYATANWTAHDDALRMHIEQGLAGKTYQTGNSYLIDEMTEDDVTDPAEDYFTSAISVPIGDHGVFQAINTDPGAFDQNDIEAAELLLSHTITALDRIKREKELERQVERLDQFASVVSHDLRTPLSLAQGNLKLLAEETDTDRVEEIAAAHDRMDRFLDDLLAFARVGTTAMTLDSVALKTFVKRCWQEIDEPHADLTVGALDPIRADRARLRQLFENLFENAISHAGTPVGVTVGGLPDGFYIEDDGPGIPAERRDSIFEAGYSPGDSGTGFGLSIVKQVVQAHGWEIAVTEGTTGGARFEITGVEIVA